MASSGQLAEHMDKYQKRNELPELGINKTWGFFFPPHFLLLMKQGTVQSQSFLHMVRPPFFAYEVNP